MGWASERCRWISALFVSLVVLQASSSTYKLKSTPATSYNLTSTPATTYNPTSAPATAYNLTPAPATTYFLTSAPATAYNLTPAPATTYFLTSTPATEGQPCTMSCTRGLGRTISTALWYRNCVRIFQTNWRYQLEMLDKGVDHKEFRSVSGRISVDATLNRHNVILTINSTVDEESVWTCGLGEDTSNNLTVTVPEPTTDANTTNHYRTTDTDSRPAPGEMTEDKDHQLTQAYILVTCGVVCCVILVISIAIILYVRRRPPYGPSMP